MMSRTNSFQQPDTSSLPRRSFLKSLAAGGCFSLISLPSSWLGPQEREWRRKKGEMHYRRLGRTDLFISEISLGGSPLPDWSLCLEIIDRGVNYIDTSESYSNGNSERQIGRLFKEVGRDKFFVGTKFHLRYGWSRDSILRSVETSLKRLQTETIDVLLIHGAAREEDLRDERVLGAFEQLKKEGKFRFNGLSCHANHFRVVKTAVDSGKYDMVQLGYNVYDLIEPETSGLSAGGEETDSRVRNLIRYAAARDVGIIAMKTLKTGRSRNLDKYRTGETSVHQAMLKWALENRRVSAVVTEMLNRDQMEDDLGAAGKILAEEERASLHRLVAETSRDYCHMCGRCQSRCPSGIATPDILRLLAYAENYGRSRRAKTEYGSLPARQTAVSCLNCARCESACPYEVQVRARIRRAHDILAG
jgi:predicted aldo/keto reductase-like oxidoreductase